MTSETYDPVGFNDSGSTTVAWTDVTRSDNERKGILKYANDLIGNKSLASLERARFGRCIQVHRANTWHRLRPGPRSDLINGKYVERLDRGASGRYAVNDGVRDFSLAPRRAVMSPDPGKQASDIIRGQRIS